MSKTSELEELRERLQKLSEAAPTGSHKKVADKLGIHPDYIYQIRRGKNVTVDNEKNRKFLAQINDCYEQIIDEKMKQLKAIS